VEASQKYAAKTAFLKNTASSLRAQVIDNLNKDLDETYKKQKRITEEFRKSVAEKIAKDPNTLPTQVFFFEFVNSFKFKIFFRILLLLKAKVMLNNWKRIRKRNKIRELLIIIKRSNHSLLMSVLSF